MAQFFFFYRNQKHVLQWVNNALKMK